MELTTISVSHYNERARWALAYYGVPYKEHRYMPMFHVVGVLRATRGRGGKPDGVSTRFSTPVLRTDEGEVLTDSAEILAWLEARYATEARCLYPAAHDRAIREFERRMHDELGPHTRRIAYHYGVPKTANIRALAKGNIGALQRAVFWPAAPIVLGAVKKGLGVNAHRAEKSLARARAVFDEVADMLGEREFLFGDRFSAADLTFASLSAPALLPERGYGAAFRPLSELPAAGREVVEGFRATAAGRFALRMFETQRPPSKSSA